jgi:hypothetical protein
VINSVFTDTANFGVHFGFVDGGIMSNNNAYSADREVFGVEPDPNTSATNVVISNNSIVGTAKVRGTCTGLIILTTTSGGSFDGITVTGNVMRQPFKSDTSNPGITVLGGNAVNVVGNTIHAMDGPGIVVGSPEIATTGVSLTSNAIHDCGRSGGWPGIKLSNAHHCNVTSNYVHGPSHTQSVAETDGAGENMISLNTLRDRIAVGQIGLGTLFFGNKTAI